MPEPDGFCRFLANQKHSAHHFEIVTVHYRWHPLFGRSLRVHRRMKNRSGEQVFCELPNDTTCALPTWMFSADCARFTLGRPLIRIEALRELRDVLTSRRLDQVSLRILAGCQRCHLVAFFWPLAKHSYGRQVCVIWLVKVYSPKRTTTLHQGAPQMNGPERRLTQRKTVERFAYINIEPSNGGSVVNVSEGGLCFHSIAPIQQSETIRFWFREHDRRIEVQGHLVWTDKAQKTAGLRFTNLPEEGCEPIRRWTSLPTPVASELSPLSTLFRHATPTLEISRPEAKSASNGSEEPALVSRDAKAQPPFTTFSGGLATGLLLSALLAAPFLLRSYKRQLGESLIHWGERFAARPHSQVQNAPPLGSQLEQAIVSAPKEESPAPQKMVVTSRVVLSAAPSLSRLPSDKLSPEQVKKTTKPQPAQIAPETPTPATSTPTPAVAPKPSGTVAAAAIATTASKTSLPAPPVAASSDVIPTKPAPLPPLEPADRNHNIQKASAENSNAGSQLYFEVGKFKNPVLAYRASDNLARFGFRATVVEKGLLWTNSYHVLVGPYADDKVEEIRKKLTSSGFEPQVFERGSRNLTIYGKCDAMGRLLRSAKAPRGLQMQLEDCAISWETYSTFAMVRFAQENSIVATVNGKWVKRGIRYDRDAFVYRNNDDGSQTLIEIQFAGMNHALVFNKS